MGLVLRHLVSRITISGAEGKMHSTTPRNIGSRYLHGHSTAMSGRLRLEPGFIQRDFAGRNVMLVPDENLTNQSERIYGLVIPRIVQSIDRLQ